MSKEHELTRAFTVGCVGVWCAAALSIASAQAPAGGPTPDGKPSATPRPGVGAPGVKRGMAAIKPIAVFPVDGSPDWQVVTEDAVWVTSAKTNTVHRLDP